MKTSKNRYHILAENDNLNMQEHFLFFDTETYSEVEGEDERQKIKLGWALYWDRLKDRIIKKSYKTGRDFWDFVESLKIDDLIIYAHNTDFDFKIVDGYNEMIIKRGYKVTSVYIKGPIFILNLEGKNGNTIQILDTFNYVPRSLEYIGRALNIPKLTIDFKTCTDEELSVYCLNDVMIIFEMIKRLIEFLKDNDLTRIKATAGSLAMNAFRHRFYDKDNNPIHIHNCHDAISLERQSYKGGISDCLKVGKFKEKLYKFDINSMYPHIMRTKKSPVKLIYYSSSYKDDLKAILMDAIKDKHIIAECVIELPEEYAYIMTKFTINKDVKCGFLKGVFTETLCTPEIQYVLKYGKILEVKTITIYDKSMIFKEYVDFFYNARIKYTQEGNEAFNLFCKSMLNNLYGKFGQRGSDTVIITEDAEADIAKYVMVDNEGKKEIIHLGHTMMQTVKNGDNAYDSFVAIASMITAYARIYLIEMILTAGREHCYYCDTDSIIVDKIGAERLKPYIDDKGKKLGKLKLEGTADNCIFYRPKYYVFGDEFKCKGVKKKHETLQENDYSLTVRQQHFEKFKTSLKNRTTDSVKVKFIEKTLNKTYDKGIVENGNVRPYSIEYLNRLNANK